MAASVIPTPRSTFSENFFALFFIDVSVNVTEARRIASGKAIPLNNISASNRVKRISKKECRSPFNETFRPAVAGNLFFSCFQLTAGLSLCANLAQRFLFLANRRQQHRAVLL